jgi:hypothetical protein
MALYCDYLSLPLADHVHNMDAYRQACETLDIAFRGRDITPLLEQLREIATNSKRLNY